MIGAGGVGGYFGARLAAGGCDVTFIARGAHLDAIRQRGLRIQSPLGNLTLQPAAATDNLDTVGAVDFVMLAVKLWDTESVAQTLRPHVDRGAAVISWQNGVQKDDVLRKYIPAAAVVGGVAYIQASVPEPGRIDHMGTAPRLVFGEYDGSRSARVQRLLDACTAAGVDAELSTGIERAIWEKFVFLVGASGTTTAMRKPIGLIRTHPRTREFLRNVMQEVVAVARAKGVALPADFADDRLAFCDSLPATATSSMFRDLAAGKRLEVPWLSGAVAEFGTELGVPTPCNRAVADLLALYESGS
jgi:2-dehydropantoate 2-reductase